MKPLLSICIPTYNRLPYLKELLTDLLPQLDAVDSGQVELIVSNNASTDGTENFCQSISRPYLRCRKNEVNIGGDRNFLKCIQEARGEYVWLVGDDDLVPSGAVQKILDILGCLRPGLVISDFAVSVERETYADYGEFLERNCRNSKAAALRHTLISANIFQRASFDLSFAERWLSTQYAHMFGLVQGLHGSIVRTSGLIAVRSVRAAFAQYPSCLCVKQAIYLKYLAARFEQPQFRRFAFFNACNLPIEYASRFKSWMIRRFCGA